MNTASETGKTTIKNFSWHVLRGHEGLWVGRLPDSLQVSPAQFEALWEMHPSEFHTIQIMGRNVKTPRWQQAYGVDYFYAGKVNRALPIPEILRPLHDGTREIIRNDINGILLNWYDGGLGHYIGRHRDSTENLVFESSIVTISLGEDRTFRIRPWPSRPEARI